MVNENTIYDKIDKIVFNNSPKNIEHNIKLKNHLVEHINKEPQKKVNKNINPKTLSYVISKKYNEEYGSKLNENQKQILKNTILMKEDVLHEEFGNITKVVVNRINELLKESKDDNLSAKLVETKNKVRAYDRRKVSQELESAFLGSGDNVIPIDTIERIKTEDIRDPEEMYVGNQMWIWEKPIEGHRYILGCDVSRGDSEDFTSIIIIDFDSRTQVAEYLGKIPPDLAADIIYKWGTMYNAYVVTDITGGMGVATSRKLQELGYKDLYVEGMNTADKWKYNPNEGTKTPGLAFNNKRAQIVAAFEESLRHKFTIRSKRLLNELYTFVYINGKPNHMKGKHDDLIMAIAMALYVGENSFSQLHKADSLTKAMLESWTTSNSSVEEEPSHRRRYG